MSAKQLLQERDALALSLNKACGMLDEIARHVGSVERQGAQHG